MKTIFTMAGILALSAGSVFAGAVATDGSWTEFQFGVVGTFASGCSGACLATVNPVASQVAGSPWTFSGAAVLTVTDLFLEGDQFQVFDNSVSLGDTSVPLNTGLNPCTNNIGCALANSDYSTGVFDVGGGDHSITIEVIQNALGSANGAAALSVDAAPTPEPGTMVLFGAGLGLLGLVRRRRA
jgi:hypothetical protein